MIDVSTGQIELAIISALLIAIFGLLGFLGHSFALQIQNSNAIIAAIQEQAVRDRQLTAVIAERLQMHLDYGRRTAERPKRE